MNLKLTLTSATAGLFLVLIVGFYIGSEKSWNIEYLMVFYSGLVMLVVGLMVRSKRVKKK